MYYMSPQFKKDRGTASVQLFAEWLATINRGKELSFLIGHQLILSLVHVHRVMIVGRVSPIVLSILKAKVMLCIVL